MTAAGGPSSTRPGGGPTVRGPFEAVVVFLMALGAVVFFEPAPFDLIVVLVAPLALFSRRLAIPAGSGFALLCVAGFALANLISLDAADDLSRAVRFAAITAYLLIAWAFVLGLSGKLGERAVRLVMLGWAWGAVLTTALGIAGYFGVVPWTEQLAPMGRLFALFKDPNVLGAYLVPPAVWSMSRLVSLERGRRLPWAITLLVCGLGVLLTFSRGAWISLAIATLVFFGLRLLGHGSARARWMTLLAVPVAALLLAIALDRLASVDVVAEMLGRRLSLQSYDVDRFATQREALELAAARPLGIGPGQSEAAFTRAAHNTYLRAFAENGYLGGLSLLALMVASLLRSVYLALELREPRLQTAMAVLAGSLTAICIESLVIDSVHWRHLWLLLALAWTPRVELRSASR